MLILRSIDFTGRRPSLEGFFGSSRMSPAQMQHIVGDKLPNAFANFSSQVGKAFSSVSQVNIMDGRLFEWLANYEGGWLTGCFDEWLAEHLDG